MALVGEIGFCDVERAHPVRLQKYPQLQLIRGQRFEVVGPVGIGGAVGAPAVIQNQNEVLPFADVRRPLKHHMLEKMSETRPPWTLIPRADIVSDADRVGWSGMILRKNNSQPVL